MLVSTSRDWGNIVRDRRVELGLTQAELAERVGRARQWIVRFESGHAGSASVESLLLLLDVLELAVQVDATDDEAEPILLAVGFPGPRAR